MARDVYSLRIFATGGLLPAAGIVGPIVPAGLVYVLRDIDVWEISGGATAEMDVRGQVGQVLWVAKVPVVRYPTDWQWRGRQVFAEGEQVGFEVQSGEWQIAASGYQLTLP